MKFFFHRWLIFSFDSFLSTFNTCIQLRNVNEISQSTIMKVFQKEKIFTRFLIKIFSFEIHFTNQRSNLYWKWGKWLMWGEHERRDEWKFKNMRMKRKQTKIRITRQIIKRKQESCGNGDNFFIIIKNNKVSYISFFKCKFQERT